MKQFLQGEFLLNVWYSFVDNNDMNNKDKRGSGGKPQQQKGYKSISTNNWSLSYCKYDIIIAMM